MEPAKIDWKRIESVFVEDSLYEHIRAPKWIDFTGPDVSAVADEAYFCRPDCRHPKTAEDFFNSTPPSQNFTGATERLPLGQRNRRDPTLKRRGFLKPSASAKSEKFVLDGENQNPYLPNSLYRQAKFTKAAFESSTEKKKHMDGSSLNSDARWLKRQMSARNLFAGRDILNQITEFCHELKKLATWTKERENEGKSNEKVAEEVAEREALGELNETQKERKPLLVNSQQNSETIERSTVKYRRKKEEEENTPPAPYMDLKNMKLREESSPLVQIRTNPPSPQCFSGGRGPSRITPLKPSRCRPQERGIQPDLKVAATGAGEDGEKGDIAVVVGSQSSKGMDLFWFLKPCTLSA